MFSRSRRSTFTLAVGDVKQEVQISASSQLLETQQADVGGVIESRQINELPLNGRNYDQLALLEPGVYADPSSEVANPAEGRFSANGNLELQNYFSLDGIDNNTGSENLQEQSAQAVIPPPDALQEFRLQTRNLFDGVWDIGRRDYQCLDQVRDEPVSRRCVGISPQQRPGCEYLLQQLRWDTQGSFFSEPVRGHGRRAHCP
jgi:hypothetical protein